MKKRWSCKAPETLTQKTTFIVYLNFSQLPNSLHLNSLTCQLRVLPTDPKLQLSLPLGDSTPHVWVSGQRDLIQMHLCYSLPLPVQPVLSAQDVFSFCASPPDLTCQNSQINAVVKYYLYVNSCLLQAKVTSPLLFYTLMVIDSVLKSVITLLDASLDGYCLLVGQFSVLRPFYSSSTGRLLGVRSNSCLYSLQDWHASLKIVIFQR